MGYGTPDLAYITGLSEDKITTLDNNMQAFSISMLVRLFYELGVGLRDILKAVPMITSFAESYHTISNEVQSVVQNADLVRFLERVPKTFDEAKVDLEGALFNTLINEIAQTVVNRKAGVVPA